MPALQVVSRNPPEDVEALYREHGRTVFRAAYRLTGSQADAEDVLQTVFLRIVRRQALPATSSGAYLRRAAVNAALDILRQRRSTPTVPLEVVEGSLPAAGGDSQQTVELAGALRQALARLHPRTAEAFVLRFIEGWGNKEIAAAFGTSVGAVAVTVHRARALLRRDLSRVLGPVGSIQSGFSGHKPQGSRGQS